jgi:hypothetical protein
MAQEESKAKPDALLDGLKDLKDLAERAGVRVGTVYLGTMLETFMGIQEALRDLVQLGKNDDQTIGNLKNELAGHDLRLDMNAQVVKSLLERLAVIESKLDAALDVIQSAIRVSGEQSKLIIALQQQLPEGQH